MTRMQATWSDVDVSAYVDGQLDPAAQPMFEAALAKDQTLRHRVDAVREVVTLVRSVPLRESPRNYLLTPAMVAAKPVKRAAPRRPSLLMMRLATSLAAVAFVVTAGLNFVSRGISPAAMVMQSPEVAEASVQVEVTKQVEALSAAPPEAPAPASEPAEPAEGERPEKALAPQAEDRALSPTPATELAPAAVPAIEAPASDTGEGIMSTQSMGEEVAAEAAVEAEAEAEVQTETVPPPEILSADEAQNVGAASGSGGEQPVEAQRSLTYGITKDDAVREPARRATVLSWWIPGILGLATLCLAGMTYWISRRR